MRQEGKKYVIKESELREIIEEMILMESYDPNHLDALAGPGWNGRGVNLKDLGTVGLDLVKGLPKLPGMVIPNDWKEHNGLGDNGTFMQWLYGALNAQPQGGAASDRFPDISTGGKPKNADAHEQLSVSRAVYAIRRNATPRYIRGVNGHCARNVRIALNYGGLSLPSGMVAPSAKYYTKVLPANGWVEIDQSQAGQPGDVMVMEPCYATLQNGARRYHRSGHISMCCGGGLWVSDFVQSSPVGVNGTVPVNAIHYYRYKNIVQ